MMLRAVRSISYRKFNFVSVANPMRSRGIHPYVLCQHFSVPSNNTNDDKKDKQISSHTLAEAPAKSTWDSVKSGMNSAVQMVKNPKATWVMIKEEANHYWIGSKLLWQEIKIANEIVGRILRGHGMTRRERMQLIRTTTDIFRLVPFAVFVIVPFMEFLLPFALKLFPNMLPSTFQDSLKKEESLKHELQMRLSVAKFMHETLQTMASKKVAGLNEGEASGATEVVSFIEKARLGEAIPNDTVIRIAQLFKDELTLANVSRPQLVSMCKYMNLQPYGADAILRFQLRNKFKGIKEDDRRILWEGIDSLDTQELRDACQERGMRAWGLTHTHLKKQLDEWLSLSIQKNIPISLLIMSRAFMLTSPTDDHEHILKSSIGSLDSDTINEVVIAVAKPGEEDTADFKQRKLDSLQFQKEMIDEEREDKEDALEDLSEKQKQQQISPSVDGESPLTQLVNHTSAAAAVNPDLAVPGSVANSSSSGSAAEGMTVPAVISSAVEEVKVDNNKTDKPSADKPKKKLTLHDLQAISDMARGSSVMREKAELAILQANVDQEAADTRSIEPVEAKETSQSTMSKSAVKQFLSRFDTSLPKKGADSDVDKSLVRMRAGLKSMLDHLKVKIDSTEKALGDSLNILDKDGDGELSSEELKEAVVKILKSSSLQEAEELISVLDSDKDGRVSLVELLAYIQKKTESSEVEALEAQIIQAAEQNKRLQDTETANKSANSSSSSSSSSSS